MGRLIKVLSHSSPARPLPVPPKYSIEWLTCAIASRLDAVMVGWPGAAQELYLLTCRVLGVAVLVFRDDRVEAAELLVLRHENAVLRRQYEPADTAWFARWLGSFPAGAGQRSFP